MVTLKHSNHGVVDQFELPDSPYKEAVDIYKMEYEKAAQRYNDLYNAAWTNFSYMALVAGGLLTFGGARFVTPLTAFLACLPLLFWWIATFEPLNRYGDMVQTELGDIEKALNALCISQDFPQDARKGLTHFQNFATREHDKSVTRIVVKHAVTLVIFLPLLLATMKTFLKDDELQLMGTAGTVVAIFLFSLAFQLVGKRHNGVKSAIKETRRVRNRVRIAGLVILIIAICFGFRVWRLQSEGKMLTVPPKASDNSSDG
jgi:hypothetical protein